MDELIFEITQEADGGFVAECLTEPIFTQADNWDELRAQVQNAVNGCLDSKEIGGSARESNPPRTFLTPFIWFRF